MNQAQLGKYRERLLALGKRIQGDFASVAEEALRGSGGEASGNLSNAPFHLADLGSDNMEHEVAVGLLENEGQLLEQISSALDRFGNGTFGVCSDCQKPIPVERLDALPYTPHCVTCAARIQGQSPTATA